MRERKIPFDLCDFKTFVPRLLCQKFNSTQSFFHYPFDSLRLKIALVKDLSPDLLDLGLADISYKVVLLPYRDGFVRLPLAHTT